MKTFLLRLLVVLAVFIAGLTVFDARSLTASTPGPRIDQKAGIVLFVMVALVATFKFNQARLQGRNEKAALAYKKALSNGSWLAVGSIALGVAWTMKSLLKHVPFSIELFPLSYGAGMLLAVCVVNCLSHISGKTTKTNL